MDTTLLFGVQSKVNDFLSKWTVREGFNWTVRRDESGRSSAKVNGPKDSNDGPG